MASSTILSPRPLDLAPAASLSELDQFCSGPLDSFLEEATRIIKRNRMQHQRISNPSAHGHASSSKAAGPGHKKAAAAPGGAGKPPRAGAGKKAQVASSSLTPTTNKSDDNNSANTNSSSALRASKIAALDPVRLAKLRAANEIVRASWQYKATGSVKAAAALAEFRACRLPTGGPDGLAAQAAALIEAHGLDDTTYIYDLGNTTRLFKAWRGALPRVQPFYAVKCNPEPALLKLLASLGAGFDCASKAELEAALALGLPKDRIIFAHPCKRAADLRFARDAGIQMTTFDTESELHKIASVYPGIKLVLRVRCDDPEARCPLGLKYGCDPTEAEKLLKTAADLGLAVMGVSFHVGSGCKNLSAYDAAIATARNVFDAGEALGHHMTLLDIGGGFSGRFDSHGHVMFGDIARTINAALSAYFPADAGVRVIAEPGRYFAETSAALLVPVYGKRDRPGTDGAVHKDYWLTDGLYGSFNCILYDDQKPQPLVLRSPVLPPVECDHPAAGEGQAVPTFESTLWGPTCDSADYLYKNVQLPELRNGDWLMFVNSGAYTVAGACDFNGIAMTQPNKFYVFSAQAVDDAEESEEQEAEGSSGCSSEDDGDESDDESEEEGEEQSDVECGEDGAERAGAGVQ